MRKTVVIKLRTIRLAFAFGVMLGSTGGMISAQNVSLAAASTPEGYVARLLINEVPFPGERGYRSEKDSQAAMLAILWVLHSRICHVPPGYSQQQIAAVTSPNMVEVITAGGVKGQVDGFYRDSQGRFVAVARVHKRVDYLTNIANRGQPGVVARLLEYAQDLATRYFQSGPHGADIFAGLETIQAVKVTGRGYAWMTDLYRHSPGGNFVDIPNSLRGSLGGNRFYTLRKDPK